MTRRMNPFVGWALALLVATGFVRLGVWQLHRAQEKQAMLDAVARVLHDKTPQSLAFAVDASRARDYDWAAGAGVFADVPAVLLDNQSHAGRSGVRAYRLFKPQGAPPLLVELGWLPLPPDRTLPAIEIPHGQFALRGLLSPPPSRGLLAATAAPQGNGEILATSLDAANLPALLQVDRLQLGKLSQRVLRLDPAMTNLGYARDLDVLPNTLPPAQHVSYAMQWFGLALTVLATAAILTFRRRRA